MKYCSLDNKFYYFFNSFLLLLLLSVFSTYM